MLLVATQYDVLLVDFINEEEIDIDEMYHIGDIKCIVNFKSKFYILANKCLRMLGYYLIEIDESNPEQPVPQYIINWKSRLDFGDAQLFFLDDDHEENQGLVVCYKSIYINTYNILLINLQTKMIVYHYESKHMWEVEIRSILLEN